MFFVVPVTFSDMFILNINVFFGIYLFDLIRILLNKLCKYMLFHYFLFLFISLVCVVFVLKKKLYCVSCLFVNKICVCLFQKPAILQFLTSNNFLKRTVRYCFFCLRL